MRIELNADEKNFRVVLMASDTGEIFNFYTKPQFSSLTEEVV